MLINVTLDKCNTITDEGIKFLAKVRIVKIKYCDNIIGKSLKYLTSAHSITLSICEKLEEKYVTAFRDMYPHILISNK